MPRKSRQLRLTQAVDLASQYATAGLADDYRGRFIGDMASRLQAGRGLSKKQRDWLDTLIEEGVPAPKGDPELIARIESAIAVEGMRDFDTRMLSEFAGKLRRGWDLSEKQVKWMGDLLSKAEELAKSGPWAPDEETIEKLKVCIKLSRGYNTVYWQTHGGTYKALESVRRYLEGTENADEWCVNKLLKAMARPLRELENPKFIPGQMYWLYIRKQYPENGGDYAPALIADGPYVSEKNGKVVYSALVNGEMIETANITKQRRR
jgi:hypothetical protein